jgi:hypothetical protein
LTAAATTGVAAIAAKAVKEATYHVERSGDTVIGLGDGTEESHARMQAALDQLWPYVAEMFEGDAVDPPWRRPGSRPTPSPARPRHGRIVAVLTEATLSVPEASYASSAARPARGTASIWAISWRRCSGCSAPIRGRHGSGPAQARRHLGLARPCPDPEIPVISVVDLGIVRDVGWDGETLSSRSRPPIPAAPPRR